MVLFTKGVHCATLFLREQSQPEPNLAHKRWNDGTDRFPEQGEVTMGRGQPMEKICLRMLLVLSLFAIPSLSLAANHYVRAGATGLADGSDWSNAFTALPATLIRGDTYYIADGNHPSYSFSTPVSGTALITIKKATISDHGTGIGWNNTFGASQAVFANEIQFTTSNWVFDGQTRTTRKSGHGFKIDNSVAPVDKSIWLFGAVSNITIRYTEVQGEGINGTNNIREFYSIDGASNVTISYSYIHDTSCTPIVSSEINGFTLEYSTIARNDSDPVCHSEGIADQGSDNVIVRYNVFEDIEGTGQIVVLNRGGPSICADNWDIYGNVFMYHPGNPYNREGNGNGAFAVISNECANNWRIYNNSFINLKFGLSPNARIAFSASTGTNRQIFNNLWYDCREAAHGGTYTADSNYYILTAFNVGETNAQTNPATDPFLNWGNDDFHLSRATDAGIILQVPFNLDPEGIIRGADGTWDRGAFEFGGTVIRPEPPTNLRVVP